MSGHRLVLTTRHGQFTPEMPIYAPKRACSAGRRPKHAGSGRSVVKSAPVLWSFVARRRRCLGPSQIRHVIGPCLSLTPATWTNKNESFWADKFEKRNKLKVSFLLTHVNHSDPAAYITCFMRCKHSLFIEFIRFILSFLAAHVDGVTGGRVGGEGRADRSVSFEGGTTGGQR